MPLVILRLLNNIFKCSLVYLKSFSSIVNFTTPYWIFIFWLNALYLVSLKLVIIPISLPYSSISFFYLNTLSSAAAPDKPQPLKIPKSPEFSVFIYKGVWIRNPFFPLQISKNHRRAGIRLFQKPHFSSKTSWDSQALPLLATSPPWGAES